MLFNSIEFFIFLIIVYGLYRVLPFRAQNYMLLIASYFFYGWWDWRFLFLMAFSTTIDFWVGLAMKNRLGRREQLISALFLSGSAILFLGLDPGRLLPWLSSEGTGPPVVTPQMPLVLACLAVFLPVIWLAFRYITNLPEQHRRKACLLTSIIVQLSILGIFKYFNFFADSMIAALQGVGFEPDPFYIDVILPVGISFYTFQSLSYAFDIYRGEIEPTHRFLDFALFVAYFPQLVAGPIERARHLLPEVSNPRVITFDQSTRGIYLILLGLFKKVAIADGVAPAVDQVYGSTGAVTAADVVVGTLLFAVQIYCDFSGYSDIARGTSKLFGIDLMLNFNLPYFAKNPQDFWRRWHISLSTWLSDYLYKPLGGNRGNLAFVCRNLMLTMILGGLWHGAAWNFVLWGFYHGTLLSAHRAWNYRSGAPVVGGRPNLAKQAALIGFFFLFTLYGWLLFRATSLEQVVQFTALLAGGWNGFDYGAALPSFSAILGIPLLAAMELVQYNSGNAYWYRRLPLPLLGLLAAAMIFLIVMGMGNEPAQFIYFQF